MTRYFAVASGWVQGVGFRYFVHTQALRRSVTGWVRNMEDGTVEMELQGAEDVLKQLTAVIRKGDGFIRVAALEIKPMEPVNGEHGFRITG